MNLVELIEKATIAANEAGATWLKNARPTYAVYNADLLTGKPLGRPLGEMLDLCGNAHVKFSDKRTKHYREFLRAGYVRRTGNGVVEIAHDWLGRQEYGLRLACATAAKKVLEESGVTGLRIWEYIN